MGTLLVIEDSITIRKLVELAVRGTDIKLEFATSGAEGLAKVRALAPPVVLMDYVLPDMKGIEICTKIGESSGRKPLVIVMSAKMEEVKSLFAPFPFVVDFVPKPFKAAEIVSRTSAAFARGGVESQAPTATPPQAPPLLGAEDRKNAAFALFSHLRSRFANIPAWLAEMGDASPAAFFAKRILTPDVVDRVLDDLLPIVRERLRRTSLLAESAPADALFEGRLGTMSVHDLLTIVQRLEPTGELTIGERSDIIAYFRGGRLILVTSKDPTSWGEALTVDLESTPREAMIKAEEEQARSGKPFIVSLAEQASLPRCDLSGVLHVQGRRVLGRLLGTLGPGTPFVLRPLSALPLYVDAYGRSLSFRQIILEQLRQTPKAPHVTITLESVFERREGFSKRLLQFELVAAERRVLALVDGATNVRGIAQRTNLSEDEVGEVLARLAAVELVARREGGSTFLPQASTQRRQVMVLEPDVEGFQKPLGHLLLQRPDAYELVALDGEDDLFSAVSRSRPALVLLNVTVRGKDECARTARSVKAAYGLHDVLLVAIQEHPSTDEAQSLSEAGFDAVLSKPVSYAEIERLLVA